LVQAVAGAIRETLLVQPWDVEGFRCISITFPNSRLLRDREGETPRAHGILSVQAILQATS
jgi:hypothetical protein